jgi:hypothetical protein
MTDQKLRFYIEWPEALSEDQSRTIAADLGQLDGATAELVTENALGGLELIISTIMIAMATRTGEKIVDTLWDAIKAMRKSTAVPASEITLRCTWAGGETKLLLPLDDDAVIGQRLRQLAALTAAETTEQSDPPAGRP